MVSTILPFLLLGGFSNAEIVAYLKAKLEAAKAVIKEVLQVEEKKEEEETKVEVDRTQHAQKTMAAEAEIPVEEVRPAEPAPENVTTGQQPPPPVTEPEDKPGA